MAVAQSHSQWLWSHSQSHPHSHFVAVGVALDHKVALVVALGVDPQPLGVTVEPIVAKPPRKGVKKVKTPGV